MGKEDQKYTPLDICPIQGGMLKIYIFPNKFGAAVVRNRYTPGGLEGLWELMVVKFDNTGRRRIVYNTPITNDTIQGLSDDEVEDILSKIERLQQ